MAGQKNASFLYYLRSFLKADDSSENGYGTPRNKRHYSEDISPSSSASQEPPTTSMSYANNATPNMHMMDDGDELSRSSKRRCSESR